MSASKYTFRGISFFKQNKIIIFAIVFLKYVRKKITSKKDFYNKL